MRPLDFMIIGAQKCATTTLFELLRQHPRVAMPLEKELPFFTAPAYDPGAWPAFAGRYFEAADGRLWGKATPQYMAHGEAPERIAALMPRCRLIAVLRDPIERSRSHYRMGLRRGTEWRSFHEAIAACLEPAAQRAARGAGAPLHAAGYEAEGDYYLAWSEYGRILAAYLEHFPREQLLVLFTDELERQPQAVLDRVLDFLGLERGFAPRGLGEVMHAGGGGNRIPHGLRVWLRRRGPIAALWRRVPAQTQGRLRFLYERWNTRKVKNPLPLPASLEASLRAHFAQDLQLLERLQLPIPPWADDYRLAPCKH